MSCFILHHSPIEGENTPHSTKTNALIREGREGITDKIDRHERERERGGRERESERETD